MAEQPVIDVRNMSFAYAAATVLEGVSFQVQPRELICIVGPNGGGKTTLVRLLLGLLHPSQGEIRLLGTSPEHARLRVGYMPQHAHHDPQFPVTAMDIVLMGRLGRGGIRKTFGWYNQSDRLAALEALDMVEMRDAAGKTYSTLSGGQRQRVLLARALCCRPELLLLDEPTANVDALGESRLLDILRRLSRQMTIVTVSHDLGLVSSLVERVICVNRRVLVHPTGSITGQVFEDLYGAKRRVVMHDDVACEEQGHG
ncbi:MAG: metal ABC transporter ATP-binding protein [Patescibacteria group bacterium]|nr:metal ABC transporter ATP-binding protein [Patescibacteria group bacterium]